MSFRDEITAGVKDIAPAAVAAIPIGLLFGAIATSKGLSPLEVFLMSFLVYAGGAQFAAIETWVQPVPVLALAFSTLLINIRHVLMGASIAPKLEMSRSQKFFSLGLLVDETWALAERRARAQKVTLAYWCAMFGILYLNWITTTTLGAFLGSLLGEPERLGADFAFTALFIGLIAGFGRGRVMLVTVAVSALVAALIYSTIGAPWHVAAGALAGIAAAYIASGEQPA
jgi:4-azaleucine resistance transporter AzlC